jgi:DNA invertase Pin-like site-specific DNA recombinase
MSSDKQEKSIPAQRDAIEDYARQNGYILIRWYIDEGISGDATEKREAFKEMIRDAQEKGDFSVVLCWDQSRFGRFDSLEAGYWIFPLVKAGVTKLVTVANGVIDWQDDNHRILFGINQDAGMRRYLTDLSRNIVRGQRRRAETGRWTFGAPPYGYRVGDDGRLEYGEPDKVQVVRLMYELRLDGWGFRTIAQELNDRGIPSPRGKRWEMQVVSDKLRDPVYMGDITFPRRKRGRYHTSADGRTVSVNSPGAKAAKPTTIRDAHPAIVSRETFALAQEVTRQCRKHYTSGPGKASALSGLVVCGNCGGKMIAAQDHRKGNASGRRYRCGTYHAGKGCGCCEVEQGELLRVVADKIRNVVLCGSLEKLEQKIAEEINRRRRLDELDDADTLKRRLAKLDQQIDKAIDRLTQVDDSVVPRLNEKIKDLETQRAATLAKLTHVRLAVDSRPDPKKIAAKIWELDRVLQNGKPAKVREAMGRIVKKITLNYERGEMYRNRGYRWNFVGGEIELISNSQGNL